MKKKRGETEQNIFTSRFVHCIIRWPHRGEENRSILYFIQPTYVMPIDRTSRASN